MTENTGTENIRGKRVAFLVTDGFEQIELTSPWAAVQQAGGEPVLVAPDPGTVRGFEGVEKGDDFPVNEIVSHVKADDFDALVLPGGVVNSDHLRVDTASVEFARAFFAQGKPVAAICHALWLLIEADVVDGREVTSYPTLRTDLVNAGAQWVDEEVVVDAGFVTSRRPDDLPAFNAKLIEEVWEGEHAAQHA